MTVQQRVWRMRYEGKMAPKSIATYLGVTLMYVHNALHRERSKLGFPPEGMPQPQPVLSEAPAAGLRASRWESETPREQRLRIEAEVAAGKRCKRCHLLLPCFDHGERP